MRSRQEAQVEHSAAIMAAVPLPRDQFIKARQAADRKLAERLRQISEDEIRALTQSVRGLIKDRPGDPSRLGQQD